MFGKATVVSASFTYMATVTAYTKRPPAMQDGVRGEPEIHATNLRCTPLDPIDPELRERLQLSTPHELLQTFIAGDADVREGDILVVGGREYPVRAVGDWWWRPEDADYRWLVLEDLKR